MVKTSFITVNHKRKRERDIQEITFDSVNVAESQHISMGTLDSKLLFLEQTRRKAYAAI